MRMLVAHVTPQRINAAIIGWTERAEASLRRMGMVVVPSVGDLLVAGLAAVQERIDGRHFEHVAVGWMRVAVHVCQQSFKVF